MLVNKDVITIIIIIIILLLLLLLYTNNSGYINLYCQLLLDY